MTWPTAQCTQTSVKPQKTRTQRRNATRLRRKSRLHHKDTKLLPTVCTASARFNGIHRRHDQKTDKTSHACNRVYEKASKKALEIHQGFSKSRSWSHLQAGRTQSRSGRRCSRINMSSLCRIMCLTKLPTLHPKPQRENRVTRPYKFPRKDSKKSLQVPIQSPIHLPGTKTCNTPNKALWNSSRARLLEICQELHASRWWSFEIVAKRKPTTRYFDNPKYGTYK